MLKSPLKKTYAREGVHKGMQGWICDPRIMNGSRLVSFPQYGEKENIATILIKEEDLILLSHGLDAKVNERIREEFGV